MMKNFIKRLFNFRKDNKDSDKDTVYINTVDELDQYLHDITMKRMLEDENGSTPSPLKKAVFSQELTNMNVDNLFDTIMMKTMDRAMQQKNDSPGDIETGKRIVSLLKDDGSTVH